MIPRFLEEVKIKADDYGCLYAQMPDGTFYELVADVFNNPYLGKIMLGKEVESEESRGDNL